LLQEIAFSDYEIKITSNEQIKIQIKELKELKNRDIKFYIYKPKQERSFKVVLKRQPERSYASAIRIDCR
jgi:hypothetical protein